VSQRLTRSAATAAIAVIFLGLAPSAFAVSENADAGDLPATAQNLSAGTVEVIDGAFTSGGDADVYRLCLSGGKTFSASTVGGSERDTQLFLFNAGGLGVYSNDDAAFGVRTSLLPANHQYTPAAAGEYFLAISSYNRDPQSSLGPIFPDTFTPIVVDARERGASEPVSEWAGLNRGSAGSYRITLTGTTGCDSTPPTVDLRSPANGLRVKRGAELVVDYSCADTGGSGLDSCVGTVADGALLDTSRLGEASVTVTARDHAGNEIVVTNTVTVVDETKPMISLTTPEADATYELGEQVLADYSCADEPNGSGLDSCAGTVPNGAPVDTGSLGEKTFTVKATDVAGNGESKSVTYTVVDARPPDITVTTPAAGAVYAVGEQVTADYSCTDEDSGVASCVGSVASGAAVDTGSPGEKSFTVEASDNAGNTASKVVNYSVADQTAPTITLTTPADGAVYTLGQRVLAAYSCADEANGSGVATCQGSVPAGAALDTSAVGPRTFEVQTTDHAGNHASKTVTYSVAYDFDGFLDPLENLPAVNRWKAGRPVPVRFSLGSYRGPAPVASGYPKVAPVACGTGAQPAGGDKARGAWKRASAGQSKRGRGAYMFVWKTDKRWAGACRQLVLKLDDGTLHRVEVQFVRHANNRKWDRDWDDEG
jgi:hypothetical protein